MCPRKSSLTRNRRQDGIGDESRRGRALVSRERRYEHNHELRAVNAAEQQHHPEARDVKGGPFVSAQIQRMLPIPRRGTKNLLCQGAASLVDRIKVWQREVRKGKSLAFSMNRQKTPLQGRYCVLR